MSSEAADLTVATRQRNNPAQYWAFFTKEDSAFWNFVDCRREDPKAQVSAPPYAEQSHERFSRQRARQNSAQNFSTDREENYPQQHP
jgi:hypothetical protein